MQRKRNLKNVQQNLQNVFTGWVKESLSTFYSILHHVELNMNMKWRNINEIKTSFFFISFIFLHFMFNYNNFKQLLFLLRFLYFQSN